MAAAKAGGGSTEALNTLLSEAYQVIDKAAGKGILKKNTAAPAAAPSAA